MAGGVQGLVEIWAFTCLVDFWLVAVSCDARIVFGLRCNKTTASVMSVNVCVRVTQARHVEGGSAGLIPSQMLEEKRKAFVKRDVELAPAGNREGEEQWCSSDGLHWF